MMSIGLTPSQKIVRRTLVAAFALVAMGIAGTVAASKDEGQAQVASIKIAPAVVEQIAAPELMQDAVVAPASVVPVIETKVPELPKFRTIEMEVTAYCPCTKCCGPKAQGITASGKHVSHNDGEFVAADKKFAFGTKLIIPGYASGKIVEVLDRGGAIKGNKLDVYFDSHTEALKWGRQKLTVTVVE